MLTVRQANLPDDYETIARVIRAEQNEGEDDAAGTTGSDLAHDDEIDAAHGQPWARFVAELDDVSVGVAHIGHSPMAPIAYREGKVEFDLRVRPEAQGRGIGKALYQAVLDYLAPLDVRELHTLVWWKLPRPIRFLRERGFVEQHRRIDQRLEVTQFDFAHFVKLEQDAIPGIVIRTYAELAGDPQRNAKLHALDAALWQDVPYGEPVSLHSLEQFEKNDLHHPDFVPEACFIAVHVSDGAFVGYISHQRGDTELNIEMMGVLPGFRQRGLGTQLKLHSIRYAHEHGYARLSGVNDYTNAGMLALNRKLGFVIEGQQIRFVRTFSAQSLSSQT